MYVGIDVGGTNLVAGVVERTGALRHKASCPVDRSWTPEALVNQLVQLSRRAVQEAGYSLDAVEEIGVGFPGLVDGAAGVVVATPNMPFQNTPFRALFQRQWDIPIRLGNDADCAVVGEFWAGAAKDCDPVLMITLGTGIGGGLVKGGRLYTGFGGTGLEVGHLVTHPNGERCGCGRRGCWERYGSATALILRTKAAMGRHRDSALWAACGGNLDRVEGRTPFQAAQQGDAVALQVLEEYREELSYGLITLCNVLFPEVICLGGGVSGADEALLLRPLEALVHAGCFNQGALPKLMRASLGNDAGVIGAAMLCRTEP